MNAPFRRSALYASLFTLAMPVALAQDLQLEEIIVTAQKREESLQDVPISLNAVTGVKMEQAGITNLEKLTAYVPNFSMNQTGISNALTVRGISSGVNQGFEQSVGMYVDGIYFGRGQLTRLPMFDLQRVEVLRGPQPILFGKNSIAGAISMITQRPSDEFEGSVQMLYEPDHEERDLRAVVSGPLTDTLSGRIAFLGREMDGWVENAALSDRNEKQEEERVIRTQLRWDASDTLTFNLKYEKDKFDTVGRNIEDIDATVREDLTPLTTFAVPGDLAKLGNPAVDIDPATGLPRGQGFGVDYLTALPGYVAFYNGFNNLVPALGVDIPYVVDDGKYDGTRTSGQMGGDLSNNDIDHVTLDVDYGIGEFTLTSVTGWLRYSSNEQCDCDYIGVPIIDGSQLNEEYEQFSQELRLTSPGGETIDYIAGLFYQESEQDLQDLINLPPNNLVRVALVSRPGGIGLIPFATGTSTRRMFEQDTDMWAVFGQGTWNVSDAWRLTLGGRYTQENKDGYRRQSHYDSAGVEWFDTNPGLNAVFGIFEIEAHEIEGDRDEDSFTPQVTVQWDATDDMMLYATYVKGFKSGGYDNRSNTDPRPGVGTLASVGAFEYEDEEAESLEAGFKAALLDGAAELNGAVFYTEYTDLQTSVFDGTLGFNVSNAGSATTQGVELDGRWAATSWLSVSGSLGYLDFEFDEFTQAQCWFGQFALEPASVTNLAEGQCDASGGRKEFTPEWKGSLTLDGMFDLTDAVELRPSVDFLYSDEYLWNATLDPRNVQDSYWKINARIALSSTADTWEVALIGNNLTDEEIVSYGGNLPLAGTLTRNTGMAYYAFTERPRTYSLQATYRF
jgi:outer membrane receptor protein involved in Fe transport